MPDERSIDIRQLKGGRRITARRKAKAQEERVYAASQWRLMWWRFRKHRLAMVSAIVVCVFYLIALFPEFFATTGYRGSAAKRSLIPPQPIHWFDNGKFRPHVYAISGARDPNTFQMVWKADPEAKIPVYFFAKGVEYKLLGLIPANRHLIGVGEGLDAAETIFLMGTDIQGRDLYSRLMFGTRVSMSIGLVGVLLTLIVGIFLGGISGYYGGTVDNVIQRGIEVVRSIPTIPLWMGLGAALPRDWSVVQTYFAITIVLSLFGWTALARVVRGRFLSLRDEDFVAAAEIAGAGQFRIIFRHMLPSFASHIIAATTLRVPGMIIAETALSFLGLGMRPPAVSWGVLLQAAQSIESIALTPWQMIPAIPVIIVVLAFNFLGDGLRDAADPYQ
jgi:peptide/nickel transport system permease protein